MKYRSVYFGELYGVLIAGTGYVRHAQLYNNVTKHTLVIIYLFYDSMNIIMIG